MKSATVASPKPAPRETLNIRISAAERNLIDRAALSGGKTRTDFALSAAVLVAYHLWCGKLMLGFRAGRNTRSHAWYRWFNESTSPSESFFAPCPRGLEALLAGELARLGGREVRAAAGGVAFSGGWETCYAANLWSRLASRVLWRVAEFRYASEKDLYEAARAVAWPALFPVGHGLRVNLAAQKSPLKSLDFATLRVKDAICDRFRDTVGSRPNVDRANPDVRVHVLLDAAHATLYLDTSGEPLFKRGWRAQGVEAPLRENLAAGIVLLSGWKPDEPLLDPMCGGGTLLVEAAAIARNRAPGARTRFGFEKLTRFDARLWQSLALSA